MRLKIFFLLSILFFTSGGISVAQRIKEGPEVSLIGFRPIEIMGSNDSLLFVKKKNGLVHDLMSFDKNTLGLIQKTKVNEKVYYEGKQPGEFIKVLLIKNNWIAFYKVKKDRKYHVYINIIDGETGEVIQDKKVLFTVDDEYFDEYSYFKITSSPNLSKVLIWITSSLNQKYGKTFEEFFVYQNDFELIFKSEVLQEQKYSGVPFIKEDASIISCFYDIENQKVSFINYDANKDFEKWEESILTKLDNSIYSSRRAIKSMVLHNGDIIFSSLYNSDFSLGGKKPQSTVEGMFALIIDGKSYEVKSQKYYKFDQEYLNNIRVKEFLKVENEYNAMGYSKIKKSSNIYNDPLTNSISIVYEIESGPSNNHKGLYVLNIDEKGNQISSYDFFKYQQNYDDFRSYGALIKGGYLNIYYNENKNVLERDYNDLKNGIINSKSTALHERSYSISETDEKPVTLLKEDLGKFIMIAKSLYSDKDNRTFMFSKFGSKFKLNELK